MNTDQPKFCRDCRHVEPAKTEHPRCLHPKSGKTNLVTGEPDHHFCETQRRWNDECGRAGAWFEPREPKP